jgi:hypothetical protein
MLSPASTLQDSPQESDLPFSSADAAKMAGPLTVLELQTPDGRAPVEVAA